MEICTELFKTVTDFSRINAAAEEDKNLKIVIPAIYKQSLLSEAENKFPYNIIINFSATTVFFQDDFNDRNRNNFIIVFDAVNIFNHREILSDLMYHLATTPLDYNVTVLIGYGNNQLFNQQGMLYGIDIYLSSLNPENKYAAVQFQISDRKNSVCSEYSKNAAPAWLLENVRKSAEEALQKKIISKYISRTGSQQDVPLFRLTEAGIPAVSVNFHDGADINRNVPEFLKNMLSRYNPAQSSEWTHHSLTIPLIKGNSITITEYQLVKMVIILLFFTIAIVTALSFFNHYFKRNSWRGIKKIYFIVPLIFLILVFNFRAGGFILKKLNYFGITFMMKKDNFLFLFLFQLSFSLILLSQLFYFIAEFLPIERIRTLDFLVLFSAMINLILFVIIDISFLPVFFFIFLVTLLQLTFQGNIFHAVSGFFLIIPYFPYIIKRFEYEDFSTFFMNSQPFFYEAAAALALLPFLLYYFRCICSIKVKSKEGNIKPLIFCVFVSVQILQFAAIRIYNSNIAKHYDSAPSVLIRPSEENTCSAYYKDTLVLGKKVRNLIIADKRQPEVCSVMITSAGENPVLYSASDFEVLNKNCAVFKIPSLPPKEMHFSYAVPGAPSEICITTIYKTEKENVFELETQYIHTKN